jgi:hypothetical protein
MQVVVLCVDGSKNGWLAGCRFPAGVSITFSSSALLPSSSLISSPLTSSTLLCPPFSSCLVLSRLVSSRLVFAPYGLVFAPYGLQVFETWEIWKLARSLVSVSSRAASGQPLSLVNECGDGSNAFGHRSSVQYS